MESGMYVFLDLPPLPNKLIIQSEGAVLSDSSCALLITLSTIRDTCAHALDSAMSCGEKT